MTRRICLPGRPTPLPRVYHRPGCTAFLRHPIACLLPARDEVCDPARVVPKDGRAGARLGRCRPRQGRVPTGTGISTRCPSTTPVGLALGPDLPWADEP